MRPARYTVTGANTPVIVQVDYRSEFVGVIALASGGGNYDVAYARSPLHEDGITPTWVDFTGMSGATTTQDDVISAITGIRITLNSGDQVDVDIAETLPA